MKVLAIFLLVVGIGLVSFPMVKYFMPQKVQFNNVYPVEWPVVTGLGVIMVGGMALYASKRM